MTRRTLPVLLLALAIALTVVAGCSSSDDAADTSTTQAATTTTTKPELTDKQIIANINKNVRPALAAAFEPKVVDCILSILEDGGTGKLSADDVVPAYQARCGVTVTHVTGVITGAALVGRGATKAQGDCVADTITKLTYDQASALDEDTTNALYESCGIDVKALGG